MKPVFSAFGRLFPSYGVLSAAGIVLALIVCLLRARRIGMSALKTLILFTFSLTAGLSGAVVTHFLVTAPSSGLSGYQPGFVFYGGLIFGFFGAFAASRLFSFSLTDYAPSVLPALPLAHALGRVGCFFAGCCYGREFPFGILHPDGIRRFPVQLAEAAVLVVLSLLLIFLISRGAKSPLKLYVLLYAPARFFLEFFRGDAVRGAFLFFSTSQWISLLLIVSALLPVKKIFKG